MDIRVSTLAAACAMSLCSMVHAAAMPSVPSAPPAVPQGWWYMGALGGPSYVPDINGLEFEFPTWQVGAQVGYHIAHWRLEGEFAYLNNEFEDLNTKLSNYLGALNLMYELANDHVPFLPYVGFGVGGLHTNWDDLGIDESGFAFQAIAGASVPLSDSISLFMDYRYINADIDFIEDHYQTHTVNFGANFRFDV